MKNNGKENIGRNWVRKLARLIFFVVLVFVLSGGSLVFIDQYLFPRLATVKWLGKYKFLKKITEDVVVVNKTEQVTVSEDQTISRYSNKSASSVVEVVSYKRDSKNALRPGDVSQVRYGSGLVVTADGLVLTYKDAIFDEQSSYRIFVGDRKSFDARLVAVDMYTNLVFLKIDEVEDLPVASFIAPEDIKIGAKVVAIGRSGNDFQIIFKSGLISQYSSDFSLAGPLASSERLQGAFFADFDMYETGDEKMLGSAIADYNSNVVGILGVRRIAEVRQYFIIPVNHIESLISRYLSNGVVKRGTLGIYYLPLTQESAYLLGGSEKGALVYSSSLQQGLAVLLGSAAERAGIKIMDVITNVNGEEVNSQNNLAYLVSKYKPGDEIELKITRDGKEMVVPVVLE